MPRLDRLAALLLSLPLLAGAGESGRAEDPPAAPAQAEAPSPPAPPSPEPASPAPATQPPAEPPRWRVGVSLGSGTSYGHSYVMFGGAVGFQVVGGFELALDGQYWGGANPHLGRVAPGILWYAPVPFRPYLGAYYARWLIAGQPDENAIGGRAGLAITSTPSTAFSAGLAFERRFKCQFDCEAWWPELSFGFRF